MILGTNTQSVPGGIARTTTRRAPASCNNPQLPLLRSALRYGKHKCAKRKWQYVSRSFEAVTRTASICQTPPSSARAPLCQNFSACRNAPSFTSSAAGSFPASLKASAKQRPRGLGEAGVIKDAATERLLVCLTWLRKCAELDRIARMARVNRLNDGAKNRLPSPKAVHGLLLTISV